MASYNSLKALVILVLALAFCVQGTVGEIACENLNQDSCAFAVSSFGKRCVLEKHVRRSGEEAYTCDTSEIEADKLKDWIETDECIEACGLNRNAFGISSDSLLESHFIQKLCLPLCYDSCPNIIDLYFNLAASEGVFLPKFCEAQVENAQGDNARRETIEIKSSGYVTQSDEVLPVKYMVAPATAPAYMIAPTVAPISN